MPVDELDAEVGAPSQVPLGGRDWRTEPWNLRRLIARLAERTRDLNDALRLVGTRLGAQDVRLDSLEATEHRAEVVAQVPIHAPRGYLLTGPDGALYMGNGPTKPLSTIYAPVL